jgi:Cation/multidrug efflux pump
MPGFWLLNVLSAHHVGGYLDPVYFTATGMIGMIALSGIVTRDSIISWTSSTCRWHEDGLFSMPSWRAA